MHSPSVCSSLLPTPTRSPRGQSGRVLPSVNPEDFDVDMLQRRSGPLASFLETLCEGQLVMDMDRIFTKSAELTNSVASLTPSVSLSHSFFLRQ